MNAAENIEELIRLAMQARANAYAPYSGFQVGAVAVDANGVIHAGCNVENAAYGPTNCAERTALFRAIADGVAAGSFQAMAVVADTEQPVTPCGVCRQVMVELCPPDMPVYLGNMQGDYTVTTVGALLPGAFDRGSLRR
jgi:cytidine deaminase